MCFCDFGFLSEHRKVPVFLNKEKALHLKTLRKYKILGTIGSVSVSEITWSLVGIDAGDKYIICSQQASHCLLGGCPLRGGKPPQGSFFSTENYSLALTYLMCVRLFADPDASRESCRRMWLSACISTELGWFFSCHEHKCTLKVWELDPCLVCLTFNTMKT